MPSEAPHLLARFQKMPSVSAGKKAAAAKAAPANAPKREAGMVQNPVYNQLRISLAETEARVASNRARVREYESRIVQLRANAANVPKLEAELTQPQAQRRRRHRRALGREGLHHLRIFGDPRHDRVVLADLAPQQRGERRV